MDAVRITSYDVWRSSSWTTEGRNDWVELGDYDEVKEWRLSSGPTENRNTVNEAGSENRQVVAVAFQGDPGSQLR